MSQWQAAVVAEALATGIVERNEPHPPTANRPSCQALGAILLVANGHHGRVRALSAGGLAQT
jgi:hypothetical protein